MPTFQCRFKGCQITVTKSSNRPRHERKAHGIHIGRNSYLCPYPDCKKSRKGKGFNEPWGLETHKRIHTQNPYLTPSHIATPPQTNLDSAGPSSNPQPATDTLVLPFECNGYPPSLPPASLDAYAQEFIPVTSSEYISDARRVIADPRAQELNPIMSCPLPSTPPPDKPYIKYQASNGQYCQAFETTTSYTTDPYDRSTQRTYPKSGSNSIVLTNEELEILQLLLKQARNISQLNAKLLIRMPKTNDTHIGEIRSKIQECHIAHPELAECQPQNKILQIASPSSPEIFSNSLPQSGTTTRQIEPWQTPPTTLNSYLEMHEGYLFAPPIWQNKASPTHGDNTPAPKLSTAASRTKCDMCWKSFSRRQEMLRHKRTHTSNSKFKCSKCRQDFTRVANLNRHLRVRHQILQAPNRRLRSKEAYSNC